MTYRYFKSYTPLDLYDDETVVPVEYDNVIVYGAMLHMDVFLDNNEQADFIERRLFKPALSAMRTILINDDIKMLDTRVNY